MKKPFLRRFTKKIFIFSNIIIGILFLMGANAQYFDPKKWWWLDLVTLLLPYLLFLLVLFIFFWLFIKPVWSALSLLFIALSFRAATNIIPPNPPSHFLIEKIPGEIRVMSWNVELFNILQYKDKPQVRQQMFDLINKYNPDIACFQEVVAGENKKAINYLPDIFNALHFHDYLYSYQLRDDFDRHHHFGILVFSKYPIVRKQTIVNNPDNYNSTFQFIDVIINGDTVRVFNVHLQSLKFSEENLHYLDSGVNTASKNIEESKSIIAKIKTGVIKRSYQAEFVKGFMNNSPYPMIVCGDFNDVPNSYAYETIRKGLQDAFVEKGFGLSRTFSEYSPTLRIDNIFVGRRFKITQFTRIKKRLSDHFPIVADMKLTVDKN